jgi:hypothetical protein
MTTSEKRFYIVDVHHGNYYKLSADNNLVVARDCSEAATFSIREANARIGSGKKAKFYTVREAPEAIAPIDLINPDESRKTYNESSYDTAAKSTMFDSLQNNWEERLSELCYMSSHMKGYQANLNQMLSDVDKEICDILHFIEFNDPDDTKLLQASKMLQERRRHRREIKDEMEKTALMRDTFLDRAFEIKVHQSLELMERMKTRIYTPRKLDNLFNTQVKSAIA